MAIKYFFKATFTFGKKVIYMKYDRLEGQYKPDKVLIDMMSFCHPLDGQHVPNDYF